MWRGCFFFPRADFFEDEAIQHVLKYKPWWVDAHKKMMALQGKSHQEHDTPTFGENMGIRTPVAWVIIAVMPCYVLGS